MNKKLDNKLLKENKSELLDQYYTKESISIKCCNILNDKLSNYVDFNKVKFLEPSAGTGSFIKSAKNIFGNTINIDAYDLEPKDDYIKQADFLNLNVKHKQKLLTLGNPPFGKRSKLAIDFFNKAAQFSHTIAFIVPLQFDKYSVQNHLNKDFKLIHSEVLEPDAFLYNDKSYKVRCCFQIWTTLETTYKNLRILKAPDISHPDFELYQYNNTKEALKYFNKEVYKWDFAVPRQGYYDYSLRIKNQNDLKKNVQYIFFRAKDVRVKEKLFNIDFSKLSEKNTTVPGFGKADVIQYYKEIVISE